MQILAVVVRYKVLPENSATIQSLHAQFLHDPDLLNHIGILLWDNSPASLSPDQVPGGFEYVHSQVNGGVSAAYNGALERAEALGCSWLLLLDQDTLLPGGYLNQMLDYSRTFADEPHIATIVPFVRSGDTLLSPRRSGWTLRSSQIPATASGIIREDSFAINSGALMRAAALRAVGGYSNLFWLDLSDQYVFHLLYEAGWVIYLAADLQIQHSIANTDYNSGMSIERYRSYLAAENIFSTKFHSPFSNGAHNMLLLARALRQYRRFTNKQFARLTLLSLWQRLFLSRNSRIDRWTEELTHRTMPIVANRKPSA